MGLFGAEKKPRISEGVDSIIGENAKFRGELITKGSVSIGGEFEGKLQAEGEVIISPGSKIAGDVYGGTVIVSGKVNGNIYAGYNLEITKSGRVNGDLTGGKITIEEGSTYRGRVKVESGAVEEEVEAEVEEKAEEVKAVIEAKEEPWQPSL